MKGTQEVFPLFELQRGTDCVLARSREEDCGGGLGFFFGCRGKEECG